MVNICVVGYGMMGLWHTEALKSALGPMGVVLHTLVGRRADAARDFAAAHGFRYATTSLDEVLADPALDAVILATPSEQHEDQAVQALAAGKHLLRAIRRARPPPGTRDRPSPGWLPERGASERCWAYSFRPYEFEEPEIAADQLPGIGRTGMISIDSPGKIVKCGWFSNSLAAASCEPAVTTMKAPNSLLTSSRPRSVIFFVLPSGPPIAETDAWCRSTHACQAAMPSCSLARRSASGSAIHAFMRGLALLPRNTAR